MTTVDNLITNQYKGQLPSRLLPITITPNISSNGVTVYPQSLSPTIVVMKRRCKNTTINACTVGVKSKSLKLGTHTRVPNRLSLVDSPVTQSSSCSSSLKISVLPSLPTGKPNSKPTSKPSSRSGIQIPDQLTGKPSGKPTSKSSSNLDPPSLDTLNGQPTSGNAPAKVIFLRDVPQGHTIPVNQLVNQIRIPVHQVQAPLVANQVQVSTLQPHQ